MELENQRNRESEASEIGAKATNVASFMLVAKLLSVLFNGAAFIIVARILGPSVYGVYTLAIAVVGVFGAFGDFGISSALSKFLAEYAQKKKYARIESLVSNSIAIMLIGAGIFTALAILFSGLAAQYSFHNVSDSLIIQVAAFTIILGALFGASYVGLIGLGNGKYVAISVGAQSLVQAIFTIGLALLGFGAFAPIYGLIIGFTVGFAVVMFAIFRRSGLKIRLVRPKIKEMRGIMDFALPLALYNLVTNIVNNFSYIVLGIFATTAVIGNFGIASKTGSILEILTAAITTTLLPTFSRALANKNTSAKISKFYNYSVSFSFVLIGPMVLLLAILSIQFSYTIFSGIYTLAPLYISLMCIGILIGIPGGYASTLLISANKVKTVFKYNLLISAVQAILLLALVPLFTGFGLALLIFIIVPAMVSIFFVAKAELIFKMKIETRKIARIVIANLISVAFVVPLMLIITNNFILLLIAAMIEQAVIYPIILALSKGIVAKDVDLLKRITAKIPIGGKVLAIMADYSSRFIR